MKTGKTAVKRENRPLLSSFPPDTRYAGRPLGVGNAQMHIGIAKHVLDCAAVDHRVLTDSEKADFVGQLWAAAQAVGADFDLPVAACAAGANLDEG